MGGGNVPERPPRCVKKRNSRPSNNNNNSGTEESEDDDCSPSHHLLGKIHDSIQPPTATESDDPVEGIHSILSEMEREIRHTGVDPPAAEEARIGGLTIEEFIHFLALLERVKEQHIDAKESPVATDGGAAPAERTSPYDNVLRPPPSDQTAVYCNVATSPRISPPSDQDPSGSSSSSSSSSPCSSDEDAQFRQLGGGGGMPGFSLLERLFLRRYLHVIPEEAASDCGSHSARLSRALSGLSSALSYLEDVDDDRFSHEEDDAASGDAATPVPTVDPQTDIVECIPSTALGDSIKEEERIMTSLPDGFSSASLESAADAVAGGRHPHSSSAEEFSIVLALPAIIIDSSDEDPAEEPIHLPRVLDELNREEEEDDESEVTSLADCELLDESSLPLSVLMIQTSGCRDYDRPSTGDGDSERNDPTEECGCPCSLGLSDDDDDDDDDDDPVIIDSDEIATLQPLEASAGIGEESVVEEANPLSSCQGEDVLVKVDPSTATSTVETVAGTSVVTLIDAKIVSVDYEPVQRNLICSSAQLRHGTQTAQQLDAFQPEEEETGGDAGNSRLEGENVAELETGSISDDKSQQHARTPAGSSTDDSARMDRQLKINRAESIPVDSGVSDCATAKHNNGHVVDEMRRFWETRCTGDPPPPPPCQDAIASSDLGPSAVIAQPVDDAGQSTEVEGSDHSTPVPEQDQVTDPARIKSIQQFRMLWSGWPPPPPLPPPPEHYGGLCASETETGYSTDGSEPFRQRRRRAALMSGPTPPPRPTPPREENGYRPYWTQTSRPDPPLRYQRHRQPLCYYSAPEEDEDDERVKARLLADWLVLANRKRSQSPATTYRSIQRSNYSTLTSSTTAGSESVTRDTSARESESEASDYYDRSDCTIRRYRQEQDWPPHHQGESGRQESSTTR